MGNIPVLKPREVTDILDHLGFIEIRQRGLTGSFDILMGVAQLFRFTRGEMFHLFSCVRLLRILTWPWMSFCEIDNTAVDRL